MGDLYDVSQVLEKTLTAKQDVNIFDGLPTAGHMPTQIGKVKAGNPVGIVFSWADQDPSQNRDNIWWIFYPVNSWGKYYYAPHAAGLYDLSGLRQQGVLSLTEQAAKEAEANKPWYEKIAGQAIAIIGIAIIGAAFVRGYVSRK
jgi:hypothetical protein